ncbi:MAG: serine/threonine protein kinase [Planctomycetia bacterium]|nr:serine/threonine protein kinase [Planctomycetia bacterium]
MAANHACLVLALANRRGLVGAEAVLRIADALDGGGSVHELLRKVAGLDDSQLKALDAEAEAWRADRTEVCEDPGEATADDQTIALSLSAAHAPATAGMALSTRYSLGRILGRGGVARVVEAMDADLGRQVALKVLDAKAPRPAVMRLQHEARTTGQLEHPNIVPVHELGVLPATGEAFFAMKRIVGRDMRQVIREAAWSPGRLIEAFRDVCRAVAYAHSKGVIHRDLKPANVMLGDFGEVLVVDWGLAIAVGPRVASGDATPLEAAKRNLRRTPAGYVQGTPSYMSPEQAAGSTEEIDERTDVYSLGATLYEILAGRAPFESGSPAETMRLVLAGDLTKPSMYRTVSPELERICLRAMALRREDRYGSVVELGTDIEDYLHAPPEHP